MVKSALLVLLVLLFTLPAIVLAQTRRETMASKSAEFATRREAQASAAAARKEALKDKFKAFKDQKRVTIAKRLDTNLGKVNNNRTEAMLKQLERMETLLGRVETRAATSSAEGKDITPVTTAIGTAKDSIAQARDAVEDQALKDYTVSATSEAKLKEEFKTARDNLMADLKAVHQQVQDAKKLVVSAVQALEGLLTP